MKEYLDRREKRMKKIRSEVEKYESMEEGPKKVSKKKSIKKLTQDNLRKVKEEESKIGGLERSYKRQRERVEMLKEKIVELVPDEASSDDFSPERQEDLTRKTDLTKYTDDVVKALDRVHSEQPPSDRLASLYRSLPEPTRPKNTLAPIQEDPGRTSRPTQKTTPGVILPEILDVLREEIRKNGSIEWNNLMLGESRQMLEEHYPKLLETQERFEKEGKDIKQTPFLINEMDQYDPESLQANLDLLSIQEHIRLVVEDQAERRKKELQDELQRTEQLRSANRQANEERIRRAEEEAAQQSVKRRKDELRLQEKSDGTPGFRNRMRIDQEEPVIVNQPYKNDLERLKVEFFEEYGKNGDKGRYSLEVLELTLKYIYTKLIHIEENYPEGSEERRALKRELYGQADALLRATMAAQLRFKRWITLKRGRGRKQKII